MPDLPLNAKPATFDEGKSGNSKRRPTGMRQKKSTNLLTEVELEFMTALWKIEKGSVRDVLAALSPPRDLAYTSAATILRILDEKGFVSSEKSGKSLVYKPELEKNTYQTRSLKDLSAKLFNNAPETLVARLVDDDGMTQEALEEIRALVNRRLGDVED